MIGPTEECQIIPGHTSDQWYGQNLEQANISNIDSSGWHYNCGDVWPHNAGYAKIRPIQELFDGDNRIDANALR